jgi:type II secretory pathway component PulJ
MLDKPTKAMKNNDQRSRFASLGGSVIPRTRWMESCASTAETIRGAKIRIITIGLLRDLSEIKLKRTDTTLDLSQKAKRAGEEKKKKIPKTSAGIAVFYAGSEGGEGDHRISKWQNSGQ